MEGIIKVTMSLKVFKEKFEEDPDYIDRIKRIISISGKTIGVVIND